MDEYIKRKAAYDAIVRNYTVDDQLSDLDNIPAADVVPVRHGRWIVTLEFPDCVYARCDQCKTPQIFYYNKPLTNYCPNCGAKMDEESST